MNQNNHFFKSLLIRVIVTLLLCVTIFNKNWKASACASTSSEENVLNSDRWYETINNIEYLRTDIKRRKTIHLIFKDDFFDNVQQFVIEPIFKLIRQTYIPDLTNLHVTIPSYQNKAYNVHFNITDIQFPRFNIENDLS